MTVDLSIVVPCYNEQDRLPATIERIVQYIDSRGTSYELVLSDDGSTDRTRKVMDDAAAKHPAIRIVALPKNRGKGRALAEGVKIASGTHILVCDADLSTPIEELTKLEKAIDAGAGVAIASRSIKGSRVEVSQPIYRVLMGKVFNLIVQATLLPGLWDTQCGFKLFQADLAHAVFGALTTDGFAYDPEVLYLARKRGERITEVPVVWRNSAPTKVAAFKSSFDMFMNVLRVRFGKSFD